MEVYIDDMIIKSVQASDHVKHLRETFTIFQQYKMRLNPKKYAFEAIP